MADLNVETFDAVVSRKIPARSAHNPSALVIEYINDLPTSGLYVLPRESSEDGRYHIYVNPELSQVAETWLSSLKK